MDKNVVHKNMINSNKATRTLKKYIYIPYGCENIKNGFGFYQKPISI